MDAWQVIGFCGLCEPDGIPDVKPSVILDPAETYVVVVDVAESLDDLLAADRIPRSAFDGSAALAEVTRLPAFFWEPGAVLFSERGGIEYVSVWEAEARMWAFVRARRAEGLEALARGDREAALDAFDLARRVSNEPEDIARVANLGSADVRAFFSPQLRRLKAV